MSNLTKDMPSFGMRRSVTKNKFQRSRNIEEQEGEKDNTLEQGHTIINSNPIVNSNPISQNMTGRKLGDIIFNDKDSLLYYNNGKKWVPLAINDDEIRKLTESLSEIMNVHNDNTVIIEAPSRGNIHLKAGNNSPGEGGHVLVSAGLGGLNDGEIYFTVANEKALTITKNADLIVNSANLYIDKGDIIVKSGNIEIEDPIGCINSNIKTAIVTFSSVEKTINDTITLEKSLAPVILNSMNSILTINLDLNVNEQISGIIKNSLLQENSWVNVSAVTETGCPYVWLSPPKEGEIKYNIKCLADKLTFVHLHFNVCNTNK